MKHQSIKPCDDSNDDVDNIAIEIVDNNEHFMVINKPADLNFHDEGDLGAGIFNQLKSSLGYADNLGELYPVHRLDKMTSGLLIFAKTLAAAKSFQTLFQQHEIEKYYLAISDCKPKKKQGLVKGDMEKSRRGSWKLMRTHKNPAITQFFSYSLGDAKRLFLLKPHSGKTHQIRVAMNSLSSPIYGDKRYSFLSANSVHKKDSAPEIDRGYLHAFALRFNLFEKEYQYLLPPTAGSLFIGEEMKNALRKISTPWNLVWPSKF